MNDDTPEEARPMTSELKPCPLCAGEAALSDAECGIDMMPREARAPYCRKCGLDFGYCRDAQTAIAAWNRRPLEDAAEARLREARDLLREVKPAVDAASFEYKDHIPAFEKLTAFLADAPDTRGEDVAARERVARALYIGWNGEPATTWEKTTLREHFLRMADAALAALTEGGDG